MVTQIHKPLLKIYNMGLKPVCALNKHKTHFYETLFRPDKNRP